ncbi:XRE family transcriptional regulator [uncultured Phenylobacterium sp.]|uniref:helix-turn-helix transcriptional regulator n=1 Tax=uncultured Phenylobacterium sp. TaxID=349273 RepID=UPI0025FF2940|nr:XRE family transcriptional regulator [uncultured Phenylobacterium sp.]
MTRADALPLSLPPRGLGREIAAQYLGVSVGKFDAMVADGRMPAPKRIDARKVWDREALDRAFFALPEDGEGEGASGNPWDGAK